MWNFCNKKVCSIESNSVGTLKCDCVIKTIEMFNFIPQINNSVIIEFNFLLIIAAIISSKTMNTFLFLSGL